MLLIKYKWNTRNDSQLYDATLYIRCSYKISQTHAAHQVQGGNTRNTSQLHDATLY